MIQCYDDDDDDDKREKSGAAFAMRALKIQPATDGMFYDFILLLLLFLHVIMFDAFYLPSLTQIFPPASIHSVYSICASISVLRGRWCVWRNAPDDESNFENVLIVKFGFVVRVPMVVCVRAERE